MTTALRLLDANANRAAEGLRVLEDIARFLFDDALLAERAKVLRHELRLGIPPEATFDRDTPGDVGTAIGAIGESTRARPIDLLRANAARVAEALRAAEESAKLLGRTPLAEGLERIRYASYTLEHALLARFPAWRMGQAKLYALVDTALTDAAEAVAEAVARGGAGIVQLRAKGLDQRRYLELARRVQDAARRGGALFVVNDHVAVARCLAADGIHVGQDDLPVAAVRAVVGTGCAIGVSAHTAEQAIQAQHEGADYLGLGPMFATGTKPHEPQRGPELLDALRGTLDRPSFAIGGLDAARLRVLRTRLLHGAAVAGALCRASDPQRAAAELRAILDG